MSKEMKQIEIKIRQEMEEKEQVLRHIIEQRELIFKQKMQQFQKALQVIVETKGPWALMINEIF